MKIILNSIVLPYGVKITVCRISWICNLTLKY